MRALCGAGAALATHRVLRTPGAGPRRSLCIPAFPLAASGDMAAATRPGPADARVPCPLCGGLIHPIAGRCKHCKGDLRALRSTRPAAAATLPALNPPPAARATAATPAAAPAVNGHANGHGPTNGHHPAASPPPTQIQAQPPQSLVQAVAAAAPIPFAIHQGPAEAVGVPILPPRPTGRFAAPAPRTSWKSWPVIVIILAVVAIVTAIILMLLPPGGSAPDEGTNNAVQPAPDRMDTSPTPPTPRLPSSTNPDPWSRRGGGSSGGGTPTSPPDDPDIDDPNVDDALTTRDPFSRRGGLGSRPTNMLYAIVKHACTRLSTCGTTNPQTRQICELYTRVPSITPPSCPAATRCLRSIDEMSCDTITDNPSSLLQLKDKFSECADAMGC